MQSSAWCEGLLRIFYSRIEACLLVMSETKNRLTSEECAGLVKFAAGTPDPLGGVSVCPILPGETGFFDTHKNRDDIPTVLLDGADPRDGGGGGSAVATAGKGPCLIDAVAAGAFGAECENLQEALAYALPLRAAVARTALSRMSEFLDDDEHGEYFRAKFDLYGPDIVECAENHGASMYGYPDEFPLPKASARVLYLLAVQRLATESGDSQQACLPWLAETLGLKMRCFHPGAGRSVAEAVGKTWSRKTFKPLTPHGRSRKRKSQTIPTVYLSMSLVRRTDSSALTEEMIAPEARVGPSTPRTKTPGSRHGPATYGRFGLLLPPAKRRAIESSSASAESDGRDSSDEGSDSEEEARAKARGRKKSRKKAKRKVKASRGDHRSRSKSRRSRGKKKTARRSSRSEREESDEEIGERRRKARVRDEELDRAVEEERKKARARTAQARVDGRAQLSGANGGGSPEPDNSYSSTTTTNIRDRSSGVDQTGSGIIIYSRGGRGGGGTGVNSSAGDLGIDRTAGVGGSEVGMNSNGVGGEAEGGGGGVGCSGGRGMSEDGGGGGGGPGAGAGGRAGGGGGGGFGGGGEGGGGGGGGGVAAEVGGDGSRGRVSAELAKEVYIGRSFENLGVAVDTWDAAVGSVFAACRREGHNCLIRRNKKKLFYEEYAHRKKLENRHWVVLVACTHGGTPAPGTRLSKKVMCPFKIGICWPQREQGPRITQVNMTHNHELVSTPGTKRRWDTGQGSARGQIGDDSEAPTLKPTERARQKAYADMMASATAVAARLADSVSPAVALNIFAEAMAVANTRVLAERVEVGTPSLPGSSGGEVGLPAGEPSVAVPEPRT